MKNYNTIHRNYSLILAVTFFFVALSISALANTNFQQPAPAVATVTSDSSKLTFQPSGNFSAVVLSVSMPDGTVVRQEVAGTGGLTFGTNGSNGQKLPDGQYNFELRAVPVFAPGVREALAAARKDGTDEEVSRTLKLQGLIPQKEQTQTGAFRIVNGSIVYGNSAEQTFRRDETGNNSSGPELRSNLSKKPGGLAIPADQVIADDLIVQGSGCFGFDCINNENFGVDTIRLKENNLRINFDDTSNTGGFSANDWRLVANDQASGGASYFSIEDATNGKVPFLVTANAPNSSIYVDSTGRVGLRTSTPVLDLHATTGNTPALRLEQNGSSGFNPQTWDVAGNETNFFIRDATNGSKLPFKIFPGAPSNSIVTTANGNIGLGRTTADAKLHVEGNVIIEGSLDVRDGSFSNFAAMQALYERLLNRESELETLRQKNDELQKRLIDFEQRMQAMEKRIGGKR